MTLFLKKYSRVSAFILAFLLACQALFAGTPAQDFASSLKADKCALLVIDIEGDTIVAAHNIEAALTPASITKSLTVASTLLKSGKDYKYHTRVYAQGEVQDGVLNGNLLIVGGGDPSLGADVEPKGTDILSEITETLRKNGIRTIQGRILIDSSIFPGPATHPTWGSGDLAHSYGTGSHGLNFRRNASGKSAVRNPQALFEKTLAASLRNSGINIQGDTIESGKKGKLLLDHKSPPISEIMRSCMMRSDNLYAETLLRTYALLNDKPATTDAGAALETEFWSKKGAPMQGVKLVDGSGLSRSNKFTAQFLAYVLKYMADNEEYASFFPLAGQEGTMRKLFKGTPLDSYVALKTGTMRGVRCLAGYKLDDDFAPTHVVVIIGNDVTSAALNAAAEKALIRIFNPQGETSVQDSSDLGE